MKRVAIFGSCVTRDAVGLMPEALDPFFYCARQSWISACSPSLPTLPLDGLRSPFKRRSLKNDFHSTMLGDIATVAPSADVVIFDIVDDRFDVLEMFPGRWVTLSQELAASGWLAGNSLLRRRRLAFGNPEHFRLFTYAAARVVSTLRQAGVWERTLLVRAPFAVRTLEGDVLTADGGTSPQRWNELYEPYYELLESAGFTTIAPPTPLVLSTRSHRWGPAPYHYQPEASRALAQQILMR